MQMDIIEKILTILSLVLFITYLIVVIYQKIKRPKSYVTVKEEDYDYEKEESSSIEAIFDGVFDVGIRIYSN